MLDHLHRVTTVDLIDNNVPWDRDLWCDHVLYDIPETVAGAIRNAYPAFKAFTIHEHIARIATRRYLKVFEELTKRKATLVVARSKTFERILYSDWLTEQNSIHL